MVQPNGALPTAGKLHNLVFSGFSLRDAPCHDNTVFDTFESVVDDNYASGFKTFFCLTLQNKTQQSLQPLALLLFTTELQIFILPTFNEKGTSSNLALQRSVVYFYRGANRKWQSLCSTCDINECPHKKLIEADIIPLVLLDEDSDIVIVPQSQSDSTYVHDLKRLLMSSLATAMPLYDNWKVFEMGRYEASFSFLVLHTGTAINDFKEERVSLVALGEEQTLTLNCSCRKGISKKNDKKVVLSVEFVTKLLSRKVLCSHIQDVFLALLFLFTPGIHTVSNEAYAEVGVVDVDALGDEEIADFISHLDSSYCHGDSGTFNRKNENFKPSFDEELGLYRYRDPSIYRCSYAQSWNAAEELSMQCQTGRPTSTTLDPILNKRTQFVQAIQAIAPVLFSSTGSRSKVVPLSGTDKLVYTASLHPPPPANIECETCKQQYEIELEGRPIVYFDAFTVLFDVYKYKCSCSKSCPSLHYCGRQHGIFFISHDVGFATEVFHTFWNQILFTHRGWTMYGMVTHFRERFLRRLMVQFSRYCFVKGFFAYFSEMDLPFGFCICPRHLNTPCETVSTDGTDIAISVMEGGKTCNVATEDYSLQSTTTNAGKQFFYIDHNNEIVPHSGNKYANLMVDRIMMPYPVNANENAKKELCASRNILLCFAENTTDQGSECHDSCFICLRSNIGSEAATDETQEVNNMLFICIQALIVIHAHTYIYIFIVLNSI